MKKQPLIIQKEPLVVPLAVPKHDVSLNIEVVSESYYGGIIEFLSNVGEINNSKQNVTKVISVEDKKIQLTLAAKLFSTLEKEVGINDLHGKPDALIAICDLTDQSSFNNFIKCLNSCMTATYTYLHNVLVIIVGSNNGKDDSAKFINLTQIQTSVEKYSWANNVEAYIEIDTKTGQNIERVLQIATEASYLFKNLNKKSNDNNNDAINDSQTEKTTCCFNLKHMFKGIFNNKKTDDQSSVLLTSNVEYTKK